MRSTTSLLNQFYVLGNKDRESGISKEQTQAKVNSFRQLIITIIQM
ncbi:hypothetical protein ML096_001162 [Klebsiella variicola]|nr:hypothetical protein [Klebsiella variicola]HDK5886250.1 hypothetical protein [Klebsiella variicola]